MSSRRLVIQADDLGMCNAVNLGIAEVFAAGVVTQASAMAPCPWISEGAALAKEYGIPVGLHGTLTCEWDYLRWPPITEGPSLVGDDGTQHRTLEGALKSVDDLEVADELTAQFECLRALDLEPRYLDCHMGPSSRNGFSEAVRRHDLRFLYPLLEEDECLAFDSIAMLSPMPASEKTSWLLDRLDNLEDGLHLLVTHPAIDDPDLRAIADPSSENYCWAEENRTSDLRTLLDPEIKARIDALGIELVSV